MDRNYIDMHLLTDRYLRGDLAEDEKAEFEERLVWDQELIDELDLAERLRGGLRKSVSDNSYSVSNLNSGIVGRLSDVLAIPQYAAAASFLLAVTLTVGVLLNPLMPNLGNRDFDAPHVEIIPLLTVRGTSVQPVIFHKGTTTILLVDAVGDYDSYRVTVSKDGPVAEPVWTQDQLLPTYPDSLAVNIPGDLLKAGRHILTVEGKQVSEIGAETFERTQKIYFDASFEE